MKNIEMTAVFEPCDEGGFIAYVQEISGINTQGETLEEAKENLADAVNLVFEDISDYSGQCVQRFRSILYNLKRD